MSSQFILKKTIRVPNGQIRKVREAIQFRRGMCESGTLNSWHVRQRERDTDNMDIWWGEFRGWIEEVTESPWTDRNILETVSDISSDLLFVIYRSDMDTGRDYNSFWNNLYCLKNLLKESVLIVIFLFTNFPHSHTNVTDSVRLIKWTLKDMKRYEEKALTVIK